MTYILYGIYIQVILIYWSFLQQDEYDLPAQLTTTGAKISPRVVFTPLTRV